MTEVGVIGCGMTKFGEHWEKGFRELAVEAGIKAMLDANVDGTQIKAIYGGNMSSGRFVGQEHIGALLADQAGLNPIPATRVEAACASGGLAFREAFVAVKAGWYDCVIAGGVEKMTDLNSEQVATTLGGAGDQEYEGFFGATFPALYALIARRHMYEFGTTEEQMASVAVKNHYHASLNENAQYRNTITIENVMNSGTVASPLKLLDCSPITDGAAAVILASEEFIKQNKIDNAAWVLCSEHTSDTLALHDRKTMTSLKATQDAAKKAYENTKLKPNDIDVAEVHDCFTIAEILAIEDLGFVKKGEGGKASEEQIFKLNNSELTVNPSGGLKGCGHPVGATGIKQILEVTKQLQGNCGKRQVKDAKIGLTHNIGGSGATCLLHMLSKEKGE